MSVINNLPYYLQRILEEQGFEEEVSYRDSNLYIDFPDFDMAYDFREMIKQFDLEFRLISHPETKNPTLEIFNVLPINQD